MQITRIAAVPVKMPVQVDIAGTGGVEQTIRACLVRVETSAGLCGHGLTSITDEKVVAAAVNDVAGPALVGEDPMNHEALWDRLYWLLCPRGQTGYASHAIAALDIAFWDIKGKALGQPVWRLLGGARARVPVYATFGFDFLDRGMLAQAAAVLSGQGYRHLKMVVGHQALQRRDRGGPSLDEVIAEDERRVRAVREAVGDAAEIYIDANCSLDAFHAQRLASRLSDCRIAFFEEPVTHNDIPAMADLRQRCGIAVAAGQNEGLAFRFRDMLVHRAVDFIQPNVVIGGGYTQCVRIAGLASAFNVPITNGGAFPLHNMHLHAGLANGGKVEWHLPTVALMHRLFDGFPEPSAGWLDLPQAPGLGFEPNGETQERFRG